MREFAVNSEGMPQGTATTQAEVASAFGVTPAAITYWQKRGMPVSVQNGRKRYDLAAIWEWRERNIRSEKAPPRRTEGSSSSSGEPPGDDDDVDISLEGIPEGKTPVEWKRELDAYLTREKLKAHKRVNEAAEKDMVHAFAVNRWAAGWFVYINKNLSAIPEELGPSFPKHCRRELVDLLEQRIQTFLVGAKHFIDATQDIGGAR